MWSNDTLLRQNQVLTQGGHVTTPAVLRRQDFSLSAEQHDLVSVFAAFFEKECPSSRVRDAEPGGFDRALWDQMLGLGVLTMGIPEASGGDGASLVDLALVAEQCGAAVAPVPLVDATVGARVLAASGVEHDALPTSVLPTSVLPTSVLPTSVLPTVALQPLVEGRRQLVPSGAVAGVIVGLESDRLVRFDLHRPLVGVSNLAGAPLAWFDSSTPRASRTVLAEGDDAVARHARAVLEWKVLMAATQTGVAQRALDLAVQYAKEREAFGVPIGTFQAISHPIADVAIGVEGSRRLTHRAAWYLDHEPGEATRHVLMASVCAAEVANLAASRGVHVLGGLGFTLESDLQLLFRRAKGWSLVAGDPHAELQRLGDVLYGACGEEASWISA